MKRLLYGAIPYYLTKIFSSHSPSLKYYKYIKDHKYSRHLYEFREEGMEHGKIKGRLMKVAELSNQEKLMAAGYKEA